MALHPIRARHALTENNTGSISDMEGYILALNKKQSELFRNESARGARREYRRQHPTEIAVFKCMDGRLNLSLMTKTPVGIITPFRNIGGRFNLGWKALWQLIQQWYICAKSNHRTCIVLVSYHFSKGDHHRGCAGFGYDTESAREEARVLVEQFANVWSRPYTTLHPILIGLETDEDGLVFHGVSGEVFDVSENTHMQPKELLEKFGALYPDLSDVMLADLVELVKGNQSHIEEVRASGREPIALDHGEQIIGVGDFDWLHDPNRALIIGSYSDKWEEAVATAGKIVTSNFTEGRIDADAGVVLMSCVLTRDEDGASGWGFAREEALLNAKTALKVLRKAYPQLIDDHKFSVIAGVVDANTRLLHRLDV